MNKNPNGKSGPGILRHRFLANFRIQVEDRLDLEAVLPNSRPAPSTMRNSLALTALISFSASIPLWADVEVSPTPVRTDARITGAVTPKPTLSRHQQKVEAVRTGHYDLVLIGDSITQTLEGGGEWEPLKAVWAKHYAVRNALNLGYSGYRTENILSNLKGGELDFKESPKVFILLIGTNDTDDQHYKTVHSAEEVFAGTKAIVDLIRQRHPTSKIIIRRPFPCGVAGDQTPYRRKYNRSPRMAGELKRAGELTRQLADDKQLFWSDVNSVFLRPDGKIDPNLMPDLIHPNAAGAEAAARALEPLLSRLMGDKPILN